MYGRWAGRMAALLGAVLASTAARGAEAKVSGECRQWHKITLSFRGPVSGETATPNPFTDYRLQVRFTHPASGETRLVPGYYAADGNAAETGASTGVIWRAHFAPDRTGAWQYEASFRVGENIVAADSPGAGASAGYMDGASGQFEVGPTDKQGRDLRGQGLLEYVGGHYLRFAGSGRYFLKQGADAPENLFAYADFDGPFKTDGKKDKLVKTWAPHVADWRPGDPCWRGGKGKGLIGALNYLAGKGMNSFSFIPMNIGGDDRNVFPYLDYDERLRMDVSRLDQWEIVFEHADHLGLFIHFKTQETENELLLDGGDLGLQRKLYYRELIARFAHHLALNWNLGEEINNATTAQKKAWAAYFHDHDPYHHPIVIHNGSPHYDLLGPGSALTGFSLQTHREDFSDVHGAVKNYLDRSDAAGKSWTVACDEPGDARHALRPDDDAGASQQNARKNALWGTLLAGGWGNEWYFGYAHHDSDLTLQDFRSRDAWWDVCRYALQFFETNAIPFWEMKSDDSAISSAGDYCFAKPGECYVVYLKKGGPAALDLSGQPGSYLVCWFDPRHGGALQTGAVTSVTGGGQVALGAPPASASEDWVVLLKREAPRPVTETGPR